VAWTKLSNFCGTQPICKRFHCRAYESAGLSLDTKFDFKQSIELPWNEAFFAVPARAEHGQHPKLGELHPSVMRAAQAACQAALGSR